MNNHTTNPDATVSQSLSTKMVDVIERHRHIKAELDDLDQQISEMLPVQQQRKEAVKKLHGRIGHIGDIISPLDIEWEAEQ